MCWKISFVACEVAILVCGSSLSSCSCKFFCCIPWSKCSKYSSVYSWIHLIHTGEGGLEQVLQTARVHCTVSYKFHTWCWANEVVRLVFRFWCCVSVRVFLEQDAVGKNSLQLIQRFFLFRFGERFRPELLVESSGLLRFVWSGEVNTRHTCYMILSIKEIN